MRGNIIPILIIFLILIYCILKSYEIYTERKFIKNKKSKKSNKKRVKSQVKNKLYKKCKNVIEFDSIKEKHLGYLHNNKVKKLGQSGENKIKSKLDELSSGYIVINDLLIKTNIGTNQIDHVVVCPKGIFIIETKNYSGDIYGKEEEEFWTQHLTKVNEKNKFYNPIWQNKGHVSAIRYKLNNVVNCDIISIVCFDERAVLKNIKSKVPVLYFGELKKYIRTYKSEKTLTKKQVEEVVSILKGANVRGIGQRKAHSMYVEKRQKRK